MAIKTLAVKIKGKSSLLMHQFPLKKIDAIEKKAPKEQAEIAAYRDPDTKILYIPSACIQRCFVNGGLYSKGKGRASLQKIVAASLMVSPERISLKRRSSLTFTIQTPIYKAPLNASTRNIQYFSIRVPIRSDLCLLLRRLFLNRINFL